MTARDRAVLMFVLVLAALGGGWLLVVAPKRAAAAKLGSSVQAVQQQLATLQAQVVAGQRARASFSADYVELAQLGEAVPQNDNVPSLLVELQSAARASGIDFRGLQVTAGGSSGPSPGPAAGASAGTAGTAGASAGPAGTAGASPATAGASAGTAGTAGASAAAVQQPPGVSGGSTGFGAEQFTFTFSGRFFDLSGFLGRVEHFVVANGPLVRVSGRLMTLNAISLGPAPQGFPQMLASVSATTYLLPASQGLFDGATAAGPATATGPMPAEGTGLAGASSGPAGTTSAPGGTSSGPAGTTSAPAGTTSAPAGNSSAPAAPSSTAGGASTGAGAAPAPSAAISAQSALAGGSR
ncbi:MAG: hypothetical protein M3018_03270 [Actinomycetota bacterium]|nr:hypothetical protein [Actinomycetota bacterium]